MTDRLVEVLKDVVPLVMEMVPEKVCEKEILCESEAVGVAGGVRVKLVVSEGVPGGVTVPVVVLVLVLGGVRVRVLVLVSVRGGV